jgi:hypothetical protein
LQIDESVMSQWRMIRVIAKAEGVDSLPIPAETPKVCEMTVLSQQPR